MTATSCRLGLHRWKRESGSGEPYRACRNCGTLATGPRVAGQITALATVALVLAFPAAALLDRGAPPNYRLDATAKCLRAKGYRVSLEDRRSFSVKQKSYGDLGVYFAPNVALARRHAAADNSFTEPRNRNVVIEWEGGPFPQFLAACLRDRRA